VTATVEKDFENGQLSPHPFHFILPGVARWFLFKQKNPNLSKFWRDLDWKMLIVFMAIWNILWIFGIFYDYLVHFVLIWCIFPVWVIPRKSGNPYPTPVSFQKLKKVDRRFNWSSFAKKTEKNVWKKHRGCGQ
jgi:hypothetical protein